jgi:hypothetical protein
MAQHATTVRLDPQLKKAVMKLAKEDGLSFSDLVYLLLKSYSQGDRKIEVTHYPGWLEKRILKESRKTMRLYKQGKLKGYTSVKEMMDDILGR